MTLQLLPWIAASAALLLAAIAVLAWTLRSRKPAPTVPLPTEWALAPRPVFSTDERHIYRLLREALPHHIILSKLPLVRFCQPIDTAHMRYWYGLLGASHVAFAVCSANGRVLAAIDLESERGGSPRGMQIKQAVLAACRVRYLRCPVDHLPSIAELQLLVPQHAHTPRAPQPAPAQVPEPNGPRSAGTSRRAERPALWQDSAFFLDSFLAPDPRLDPLAHDEGGSDAPEDGALPSHAEAAPARRRPRPDRSHSPSPTRH